MRLLGTPAEHIPLVLAEYESDSRALEKQLIHISFYMRGGCPLEQAYRTTHRQRQLALELIEENIKRTSDTGVMMH
jgi:hypothetical protein